MYTVGKRLKSHYYLQALKTAHFDVNVCGDTIILKNVCAKQVFDAYKVYIGYEPFSLFHHGVVI